MKTDETCKQSFLHMKELALRGNIEDEALMEYVIDGIRDSESNKIVLYGASNLKEFRKKLDISSDIKKKLSSRSSPSTTKRENVLTYKERERERETIQLRLLQHRDI
ncbi:putative blastopia polyprotein [Danaus plexippus plexippus]|uniref:Blastopia polyprotein n=1 Tax=Danaus plexippus plexippus TaxID=278856 RepID=A0A212FDP8_DANPL|nr:putative blastopia polyprotein [Danaus plexippus plexippus]